MREDYLKARRQGERAYRRAVHTGHYPYLPALDYILEKEGPLNERTVGIQEIPVSMIAGTKTQGRQNAFSPDFMPLLPEDTEFAIKWMRLFTAQEEEGFRDPIKVYEYMRRFYVQEGNKRVSVARFVGTPTISAEVIRLIPNRTDDKDNKIYFEFLDFYNVCPIYQIGFSSTGSYQKLAEEVGQTLTEPWSDKAVSSLRSAYYTFERYFMELKGWSLNITPGDAFLIYITIYRLDSLMTGDRAVIKNRISRIWDEFIAESEERPVLVEEPQEARKPGLIASVIKKAPVYTEDHPLRAAFLYERNPESSGWLYGHELGRQDLASRFPGRVQTSSFITGTDEEGFDRAVEQALDEKAEMIFTVSPAQMEKTLRSAVKYPDVKFLNCSVNLKRGLVRTFYGRMYEAKFLMGALAASMAENHRIGYLCDYPIYGSIANINAFAIGAAMTDPAARIELGWSSEKESEAEWKKKMAEEGVRVISGHAFNRNDDKSREYGLYQVNDDGSITNLAAPLWNWGRCYELIVKTVLEGSWDAVPMVGKGKALNYWFGMDTGVIDVVLSEKLSYYSRKMVSIFRNALVSGTMNPFDAELRSQGGMIKPAESPRLSFEDIITMSWLNDNVDGKLPTFETLTDTARETVKASGVPEVKKP